MQKLMRLVGIAGFAVTAAASQALVIDDFSTGSFSITANSVNPIAEAVRSGSMVGGERDALLGYLFGPLSVNATVNINNGGVQFFNSNSETAGYLILQYDGFDGEVEGDGVLTPGTGLNLDLSMDNAFVFDFRFVDAGLGSNITILTTVVTSTGTFSYTSVVPNGVDIHHFVSFSNFAGADWSNVQSLTFEFTGGPAADFTLDSIRTVGEVPGPAAAIPFLVGWASIRRRRKRR
jgi:hypothetical protein